MSLTTAVKTGDKRQTLIALRDSIAQTIDCCESGRDIAALSKRLMEVMNELDSMPDPNAKKSALRKAQDKVNGRKNG